MRRGSAQNRYLCACVPAGAYLLFAGDQKIARSLYRSAAGTHRLLAGSLKIVETSYGTIVFEEAHEVIASSHYRT